PGRCAGSGSRSTKPGFRFPRKSAELRDPEREHVGNVPNPHAALLRTRSAGKTGARRWTTEVRSIRMTSIGKRFLAGHRRVVLVRAEPGVPHLSRRGRHLRRSHRRQRGARRLLTQFVRAATAAPTRAACSTVTISCRTRRRRSASTQDVTRSRNVRSPWKVAPSTATYTGPEPP